MRLKQNNKAFTLTELMIVVIIIGVMASFAIPNYSKSVERAHRKDAETQLSTIWSADQIYRSQNGQYWPSGGSNDITAINNTLGLGIIPNGMTYNCTGGPPTVPNPFGTFTCTAVRQPPAASFTITVTQAQIDSSNPSCGGGCP